MLELIPSHAVMCKVCLTVSNTVIGAEDGVVIEYFASEVYPTQISEDTNIR